MVVGISGASGFIYGVRLLELLAELNIESHLIISRAALLTMAYETEYKLADVTALASHYHRADDVAAGIASGSFRCLGMVVAPCSMRTLAEIATGSSSGLIGRDHWAGVAETATGDEGARRYLAAHEVTEVDCTGLADPTDLDVPPGGVPSAP